MKQILNQGKKLWVSLINESFAVLWFTTTIYKKVI